MADKPLEEKKKATAKKPATVKKSATKKPAAKTETKVAAKKTVASQKASTKAAETKPKKRAAKVAKPVDIGPRALRKGRTGVVISDKMDKSIVVGVEKMYRHPLYHKIVKRTKKFVAHDPEGQAAVGDTVDIMETRPISKTKRWRLVKVVEKAK